MNIGIDISKDTFNVSFTENGKTTDKADARLIADFGDFNEQKQQVKPFEPAPETLDVSLINIKPNSSKNQARM